MADRPGVMLYFNSLRPLQVLSYEDKGRIFDAILQYGEAGTIPDFEGMLFVVWGFIQPMIDLDARKYEKTLDQRKYAAFCRKRQEQTLPKVDFERWLKMTEDERERAISVDAGRRPITKATTKMSISTPITSTDPITATDSIPCSELRRTSTSGDGDFNSRRNAAIDSLKSYE